MKVPIGSYFYVGEFTWFAVITVVGWTIIVLISIYSEPWEPGDHKYDPPKEKHRRLWRG